MDTAVRHTDRLRLGVADFPNDDDCHRALADAVALAMQRPFRLQLLTPRQPLVYDMEIVMLGATMVARLTTSAIEVAIGPSRAPDDNIVIEVLVGGPAFTTEQAGQHVRVGPGQALLSMGALPRNNRVEAGAVVLILQMPLRIFAPVIDAQPRRPLRLLLADTPGLLTLHHYLQSVVDAPDITDPALRRLMAAQLQDLCLMLMRTAWPGTTRLQGPVAWSMAARQLVAQHLASAELDERFVARELGISCSYLRKLFANGGGFAAYVRRERLDRALLLLRDPAGASQRVIDIAEACGFADLSTFNRRFKQRYSTTPTAARVAALTAQPLAAGPAW